MVDVRVSGPNPMRHLAARSIVQSLRSSGKVVYLTVGEPAEVPHGVEVCVMEVVE